MNASSNSIIAMYTRNGYPSREVNAHVQKYIQTPINTLILSGPNGYQNGIVYNDPPYFMFNSEGEYVGDASWPATLAAFISQTNIKSVYFSLGDSAVQVLAGMRSDCLNKVMTWLKRNGITGIDMDNETIEPADNRVHMVTLAAIKAGLKLTAAPYYQSGWDTWCQFVSDHNGKVEWFNLQCYAGGFTNDPASWAASFPNIPIVAGIEAINLSDESGQYSPTDAQKQFASWQAKANSQSHSLAGGFIWQVFSSSLPIMRSV